MSLQKGFFMTEPFNPDPFWDNTIVNLSGAQKFEENTVFPAGRYSVDVQAGSSSIFDPNYPEMSTKSRRIVYNNFIVNTPFCIKAYCGSKGTSGSGGVNLYSGGFKVNSVVSGATIPAVTHIFGNAGSSGYSRGYNKYSASGGNCLGNGGVDSEYATGAGSCLHFLPVGGTFGTDYLFAFHVAPGGSKMIFYSGGGGSAYGGAASGSAAANTSHSASTVAGGSTPYGNGGAGAYAPRDSLFVSGNPGTGIGAGKGFDDYCYGGAAYFDGTTWVDANSNGLFGNTNEDGHIIVKYVGTL